MLCSPKRNDSVSSYQVRTQGLESHVVCLSSVSIFVAATVKSCSSLKQMPVSRADLLNQAGHSWSRHLAHHL